MLFSSIFMGVSNPRESRKRGPPPPPCVHPFVEGDKTQVSIKPSPNLSHHLGYVLLLLSPKPENMRTPEPRWEGEWSEYGNLTFKSTNAYTLSRNVLYNVLTGWPGQDRSGRIGKSVQIRRSRATVTGEQLIILASREKPLSLLRWEGEMRCT